MRLIASAKQSFPKAALRDRQYKGFMSGFASQSLTWKYVCAFVLAVAALCPWLAHAAVTVKYEPTDLPDLQLANDVRSNRYTIDGGFAAGSTLSLYFDPGLFSTVSILQLPAVLFATPPIQPNVPLNLEGIVSLSTLMSQGVSFHDELTVSFLWLGLGVPPSQPFDVVNADFLIVQPRTATIAVIGTIPEPSITVLYLLGLGMGLINVRARGTPAFY